MALILKAYEVVLHKRAFLDGWCPKDMPSRCKCGTPFSVDHSLNCLKGGFPNLKHNEVCDFTASLSEVYHDLRVDAALFK